MLLKQFAAAIVPTASVNGFVPLWFPGRCGPRSTRFADLGKKRKPPPALAGLNGTWAWESKASARPCGLGGSMARKGLQVRTTVQCLCNNSRPNPLKPWGISWDASSEPWWRPSSAVSSRASPARTPHRQRYGIRPGSEKLIDWAVPLNETAKFAHAPRLSRQDPPAGP